MHKHRRKAILAPVTALVALIFVLGMATAAFGNPSDQGASHGKGHDKSSSVTVTQGNSPSDSANAPSSAGKPSQSHDPHHEEADGCDHGATGKPCRDHTDHGKSCEKHGNHGGINEDHCGPPTTTTTCPKPTTTTTQPPVTTTTKPPVTTITQPPAPPTTTKKPPVTKPPVTPTTPTPTGTLPRTGTESVPLGALAFFGSCGGGLLLLIARRMKPHFVH